MTTYADLGAYSDWVGMARAGTDLGWGGGPRPSEDPAARRSQVLDAIGGCDSPCEPVDVRTDAVWDDGDLHGEAVSWDVGYGPRTQAWVLRPGAGHDPLPAVVALHDHGGFKWYGKEKIADGPDGRAVGLEAFREGAYGGRAYANALARAGFVVVVPDAFMWGSRRFALRDEDGAIPTASAGVGDDTEIVRYNAAAKAHEHVVEKYCRLLGTTMAAVIAHEDRVALAYLRSRPDVIAERVGAVGLSGGGLRAGLLQATSDELAAAVVVGMMTTYEDLLDHNVVSHTWMLFPDGLPRVADWPDVVGCRPHSPLLVQYDRDDELFTIDGMRHAHEQLTAGYARAGNPDGYRGQFYDGPHKFDQAMQLAAFSWLHDVLAAG